MIVSGLGIVSAVGQDTARFLDGLLEAGNAFAVMARPGRQCGSAFLGAEMGPLAPLDVLTPRLQRNCSLSGQAALHALAQAWAEARLDQVDPRRIGLIVGGSNVQQRELVLARERHAAQPLLVAPSYGLGFMDSDLCGLCTGAFGIAGIAHTVGAASASGQVAIIQAAEAVAAGTVDVCIALGALMDLSYWECAAFANMGAMGSARYADTPAQAARPFDRARDGFIYGEACGAVVIEKDGRAGIGAGYGTLEGWACNVDANRNPNPSIEGEVRAIASALGRAGWSAAQVDYVNPHGTGSAIGDETELQALRTTGLDHALINATKSIVGHSLTAAGVVEVVATLLQMRAGEFHPSRNLEQPIADDFNWVRAAKIRNRARRALTLSMGFGGFNTALCFSAPHSPEED